MAGRIAHIPILWHSGRLPDPVNYLIIQPRGSTIDFDVPTATLLTVVEDIANALDFLASQQVVQEGCNRSCSVSAWLCTACPQVQRQALISSGLVLSKRKSS